MAEGTTARGRPREFDPGRALDCILDVFWRRGYEGTSVADLTKATGVNKPSLYAAFGNKDEMFRLAIERYAVGPMAFIDEALAEPSARDGIEQMLRGYARTVTGTDNPPGCINVQNALAPSASVREAVMRRHAARLQRITARLVRAAEEGELPPGVDPVELAEFFDTVSQGLAVKGLVGASSEQLNRVVDRALLAWPAAD